MSERASRARAALDAGAAGGSRRRTCARFARVVGVPRSPAVGYAALHAWSVARSRRPSGRRCGSFAGVAGEPRRPGRRARRAVLEDAVLPRRHAQRRREAAARTRRRRPRSLFAREDGERRALTPRASCTTLVSRIQQALRAAGVAAGDRVAAWHAERARGVRADARGGEHRRGRSRRRSPDFGVRRRGRPVRPDRADGARRGRRLLLRRQAVRLPRPRSRDPHRAPERPTVVVLGYVHDAPDLGGIAARSRGRLAGAVRGRRRSSSRRCRSTTRGTSSSRRAPPGAPKCIVHRAGGRAAEAPGRAPAPVRRPTPATASCYFTTTGWMMWNWLASVLACGATLVVYDGSPTHLDRDRAVRPRRRGRRHAVRHVGQVPRLAAARPGCARRDTHVARDACARSPRPARRSSAEGFALRLRRGEARRAPRVDLGRHRPVRVPRRRRSRPGRCTRARSSGPASGWPSTCSTTTGARSGPGDAGRARVHARRSRRCRSGFWDDPGDERFRAHLLRAVPGRAGTRATSPSGPTHGGMVIHGRSDATLNPGGVRIGTAEIYRQVETVDGVVESLVIGQEWDGDVRVVLLRRAAPTASS